MNWVFRCNIASERHGNQTVQGIGHAMRCIALAKEVERQGDSALLSVEGDADVEPFLDGRRIEYVRNEDHLAVARDTGADVVVTDINYLDAETIREYRTVAPVANLAPRGVPKYFADLTFTSEKIRDVPEPGDASTYEWCAGPEFTIINDDFIEERARLKAEYGDGAADLPAEKDVVIHMGGVDKYDRTGKILDCLRRELVEKYDFTVGVGPFNPHLDDIRDRCKEFGDNVEVIHSPDNLATVLSGTRLAILGTGITPYEALAIGVPSANVGASEFHDIRGRILEDQSLGEYLGNVADIASSDVNPKIAELLSEEETLQRIRQNGFDRVDGEATRRIIQRIRSTV